MAFVLTLIYIAISLLSPSVLPEALRDIHLLQIVAGLIFLTSLPNLSRSRVFSLRETYFILAVLFAAFLSILMTGWVGGAVSVLFNFLPIVAAYYFVVTSCTGLTRLKILAAVLFAVECSILIQGGLAVHSGELQSPYFIREGLAFRFRGLGVIADPNDLAQVLVATVPLLWLRWKKGAFVTNTFLTILPAAVLCLGVYLTHSRGGLLALVVTTLYGFKNRLGVVRSVILTGLLCSALLAFNATGGRNMNDDDGDRIGLWSTALTTFKTHPITGVGMDRFYDYSGNGLTAHNSYVLSLAELGIFGYVCWMGVIVTSWSGLGTVSAEHTTEEAQPETKGPLRLRSSAAQGPVPRTLQPATRPSSNTPDSSPLSQASRPNVSQVSKLDEADGLSSDLSALVTASHLVRSAMVGVLVSAFFISRTYAMILYIVFGISAALQVAYYAASGKRSPDVPVFKRIGVVTVVSILFLYLFVRLRGSH